MARNKLAPPTVVSVTREGIVVCGTAIPNLLRMPFPPNVLKDLHVVDLPTLTAQVRTFVETNHIKPSDLVVILNADVYFEKVLGEAMNTEISQQVQDFVDSVPLSNPSSKVFKVAGKYHAVVINRRLYESVRAAFEAMGFWVVAVVPELVLGQVGVGPKFDANACRLILRKMDFVKENSYVGQETGEVNLVNKNKGLALGLSVGSILMALAVIGVISWQVTQTKQQAIARLKTRAAEKITVSPTPTLALAVYSKYRVLLLNVPASVSAQIELFGFSNITEGASTASASEIIFLPSLPSGVREGLANIIKNFHPGTIVREDPVSQYDIQVTLSQTTP